MTRRALSDEGIALVSGVRILETAQDLARLHRTPGSPGYAAAVDVVRGALAARGIESTVLEYPADGEATTYEWTAPPAWTVRSGRLVELAPTEKVLADFADAAQSVVVHSPGGAFEGDVVHLGSPAGDLDYERAELAGKVALVCARASHAVPRAARRGAVGVIVYPDDDRAATSHDLVEYQSLFPKRAAIPGLVPSFSVSRRVADRLVRRLAAGPVAVRGTVDAEFTSGTLRVVEAVVPGTSAPQRSVLLTAHLCHPRASANDNASGSAALVELAGALRQRPAAAAARFLWMPEFYGSLPWSVERRDALRDVEYVLNLDMVGASPERIGEPLRIFPPANHTPHYIAAAAERLAHEIASRRDTASARGTTRPLHWALDRPSGGSDHLVFAASPHRLPAVMLGHDDPYWHTDLDTIDKLDPTRLRHATLLALGLVDAAIPADDAVWRLWSDLLAFSVRELARARSLADALASEDASRLVDLALDIEIRRSRTVVAVGAERETERAVALRAVREHLGPTPSHPLRGEEEPRPRRRIDGPLVYTITERFSDDEARFFKEAFGSRHRAPAEALLNHCDGTRTPLDIALLLSLDADDAVEVETVQHGIELLRKAGYVD